ncbi:MAG: 2Fe-2S iron-sulfur cluster-binding protein, partial [Alphaproteobacteria bacterium]
MAEIAFRGVAYECRESETVLDALLRQGVALPYSCRAGQCLICMLRGLDGLVPPEAQEPLRETLRRQGYFLACCCRPQEPLTVSLPDEGALYIRATVLANQPLASRIRRVRLEPAVPFDYYPGQFINIRRADGLSRSYSLAGDRRREATLEVHVKHHTGGVMSTWIFDDLKVGDDVDLQGPNGACYYLPGRPEQPLLLIGNGTGLAPLYGIARAALGLGHSGPIHLYHGSRHATGLYLRDELTAMAVAHKNFHYTPCLSGSAGEAGCRAGRAEAAAMADHADIGGWRLFLCGCP